jgi:hypothetical protein
MAKTTRRQVRKRSARDPKTTPRNRGCNNTRYLIIGSAGTALESKINQQQTQLAEDIDFQIEEKPALPYRNDAWVLSEEDAEAFFKIMENPPEPSEALLSIFK